MKRSDKASRFPGGSGMAGSGNTGSGSASSVGRSSSSGGRVDVEEGDREQQFLLMQLVGLDNSYQGLVRTLMGCLDKDAQARLARNSDFQAWANELEFFRNNDTLPGLKFARIGRPSCVASASALAVAV